jgi:hypothetical protein
LLDIDVAFQFVIIADKVPRLFKELGMKYQVRPAPPRSLAFPVAERQARWSLPPPPLSQQSVIRNTAVQSIKDTATKYSTSDFLTKRGLVEAQMKKNVSLAIEPLYSRLLDLQLESVQFPAYFYQKMLTTAVQTQAGPHAARSLRSYDEVRLTATAGACR